MKVLFFGVLREKVGNSELEVSQDFQTAGQVEQWVLSEYPSLKPFATHWRLAVDMEYVEATQPVTSNCEVAFLPPVSGG